MKKKFKYLLLAVLLIFALYKIDLKEILENIKLVDLETLLIIILLQTLTLVLISFQWLQVAKLHGVRASLSSMICMNSNGNIMDFITPGVKVGGDFQRVSDLKNRLNISLEEGLAFLILQKFISLTSFLILSLLGLGWFFVRCGQVVEIKVVKSKNAFIIFLLGILIVRIKKVGLAEKIKKNTKVNKFYSCFILSFKKLSSKKSQIFFNMLLGLVIWGLYPIKLYILVRSFNLKVSFIGILAITYITYLVGMLPLSIGGFGGFDTTLIFLLGLINIPIKFGIPIAFLFRICTMGFEFLLSGIVVVSEKIFVFYRKGDSIGKIKV